MVAEQRFWVARHAGKLTSTLSRRLGRGEGAVIGGRVALALDPGALRRLARERRIALVSGTNGKTTTSHLLAAVLRTLGPVAHNATGANMPDGALAALADAPDAQLAVLEVDELHVATVAGAVDPRVVVLGNLSRDQLDRGNEVRAVAAALAQALRHHPDTWVVANADDPMVVWAARAAARTVWVSAGSGWSGDTAGCPRCGEPLRLTLGRAWGCRCGLVRPRPQWSVRREDCALTDDEGLSVPLSLHLPGAFNLGNAALALVAGAVLGADPLVAAAGLANVSNVGDRYRKVRRGRHELRLLMAKNPAGWAETLPLLEPDASLLLVINAREADGRDTSWLWDVPFEQLTSRPGVATDVVAAGERAHDLGLRLDYGHVRHTTVTDPVDALACLPPGKVEVVANYTAFRTLARRLATEHT
ncbi:MurT ligase domain-containing protein [Pseudonocardia kujensis]|uniref:Mur ligase family protein n=1 Tax=Pseudonocardia kujensis TaxID=1128675 RepID=UPI001E32325A|nr:Mur ligase family protein [Pseudonocardia kujensis]MCE0763267.1 MurT ligase domain-containing protein [Pseudonocardia kujensis]